MADDSLATGTSARRAKRAAKHVSDYWFPINSKLVERIQSRLQAGIYDFDVHGLVSDVQSDYSLFMYCLKELLQMIRQEELVEFENFNPIEFMKWSGIDRLKEILAVESSSISRHTLDSANNEQIARFQEVLIEC